MHDHRLTLTCAVRIAVIFLARGVSLTEEWCRREKRKRAKVYFASLAFDPFYPFRFFARHRYGGARKRKRYAAETNEKLTTTRRARPNRQRQSPSNLSRERASDCRARIDAIYLSLDLDRGVIPSIKQRFGFSTIVPLLFSLSALRLRSEQGKQDTAIGALSDVIYRPN